MPDTFPDASPKIPKPGIFWLLGECVNHTPSCVWHYRHISITLDGVGVIKAYFTSAPSPEESGSPPMKSSVIQEGL